jgi:hypothetical protein
MFPHLFWHNIGHGVTFLFGVGGPRHPLVLPKSYNPSSSLCISDHLRPIRVDISMLDVCIVMYK